MAHVPFIQQPCQGSLGLGSQGVEGQMMRIPLYGSGGRVEVFGFRVQDLGFRV